jgi:DNA-binding protein H-NS
MKRSDLEFMSIDELWDFQNKVATTLTAKLTAEMSVLDDRLRQLNRQTHVDQIGKTPKRRSYPTVYPKFRNPLVPSETWSGRGKQPRWLVAQLSSGNHIDDFRIKSDAAVSRMASL